MFFLPNTPVAHLFPILLWKKCQENPLGVAPEPWAGWEAGEKEKQAGTTGIMRLPFKATVGRSPGQPLPCREQRSRPSSEGSHAGSLSDAPSHSEAAWCNSVTVLFLWEGSLFPFTFSSFHLKKKKSVFTLQNKTA